MPDRYWSSDMDTELFDPRTAFAQLGRIMLGVQDLNQTLQRIADLARKTIPEIDEVSVTLVDHQRRQHRISGVRLGSPAPRRHP